MIADQSRPGEQYSSIRRIGRTTCAARLLLQFMRTAGLGAATVGIESVTWATADQLEEFFLQRARSGASNEVTARNQWLDARNLLASVAEYHGLGDERFVARLGYTRAPTLANPRLGKSAPLPDDAARALFGACVRHYWQIRRRWRTEPYVLDTDEAMSLLLLFSFVTGWEPDCVRTLQVGCMSAQGGGSATVAVTKRRAAGRHYQDRPLRDGTPLSPAAVLRFVIKATEPGRKQLSNETGRDVLDVWVALKRRAPGPTEGTTIRTFAGFELGIYSKDWRRWMTRRGLDLVENGEPLRITLRRVRKWYRRVDYLRDGNLHRFANGQTLAVADAYYADLPELADYHDQSVELSIDKAFEVRHRIIHPADRHDDVDAATHDKVVDGRLDAHFGSCVDITNGPMSAKGEVCPVAGHACWGCANAVLVVGARHLEQVLRYRRTLLTARDTMSDHDFRLVHGLAWDVIHDRYLPEFDAETVKAADQRIDTETDKGTNP
ncbi:MAG: hypothetical protein JJU45_19110 [Acidimicrobiia bacterium]|nr:hypothetical protein [Acidimicrobiia bacterium]